MKKELRFEAEKNPVGKVDREAGIIYGVSILTAGREAKGHGVYVDETMLGQVITLAQAQEPVGVKCRLDHPNPFKRTMGSFVGRLKDARRNGMRARMDLHIEEAAAKAEFDIRDYVLTLAENDPAAFATSIVFDPAECWEPNQENKGQKGFPPEDDPFWLPHARVEALNQCDVVDEGAANEALFNAENSNGFSKKVIQFLREHSEIISFAYSEIEKRKEQKLERREETMELEAAIEKITELENSVKAITAEKAELATSVETLGKAKETAHEEGISAGVEQERANFKRRLEKFDKDSEFVIECLELTDAEAQEKYIERLKKKIALKPKGAPAIPGDGDGDDPVKPLTGGGDDDDPVAEYNAKLAEYVEKNDGKKGTARRLMASNHPELHKAWVAAQGSGPKTDDE